MFQIAGGILLALLILWIGYVAISTVSLIVGSILNVREEKRRNDPFDPDGMISRRIAEERAEKKRPSIERRRFEKPYYPWWERAFDRLFYGAPTRPGKSGKVVG